MKKTNVFISYSWDSDSHKAWVKQLSDKLNENEITTILDQNDLALGDPLTHFMEQSIASSDYVLLVCTPEYKYKADSRKGGVGYEESIITADVYTHQNHRKYIPILAAGSWETSTPVWANGKLGVDLRDNQFSGGEFLKLISTITGNSKKSASQLPTRQSQTTAPIPQIAHQATIATDEIRILNIIKEDITAPRNDGTRGSALYAIPFQLSAYPSRQWCELFLQAWRNPSRFSTMHRPNIAKIVGDRIILDGTTIEEYKQYHHETLQSAVSEANRKKQALIQAKQEEVKRKAQQDHEFRSNIDSQLNDINF